VLVRACVRARARERERVRVSEYVCAWARAPTRTCKMLHYLFHSVTTVLQTVEFNLMCGGFPWTI
jgi:hypothetical protein